MKKSGLLFLLILYFILAGCTSDKKIEQSHLSATPLTLSMDETKSYKQIGVSSIGKIGIQYKGDKQNLGMVMEVWRNGEKLDNDIQLGELENTNSDKNLNTYDGECIVSINQSDLGKNILSVCKDNLSKKITQFNYTLKDQKHNSIMAIELNKKIDSLNNKDALIWGIQASDSTLQTIDLTNESLKRAEWALIFKLIPDNL